MKEHYGDSLFYKLLYNYYLYLFENDYINSEKILLEIFDIYDNNFDYKKLINKNIIFKIIIKFYYNRYIYCKNNYNLYLNNIKQFNQLQKISKTNVNYYMNQYFKKIHPFLCISFQMDPI